MLHVSLRHSSDSLTGIGAVPLDDLQMLLNRLDFPALRLEKPLGATLPCGAAPGSAYPRKAKSWCVGC
jgi:hypothetical protein